MPKMKPVYLVSIFIWPFQAKLNHLHMLQINEPCSKMGLIKVQYTMSLPIYLGKMILSILQKHQKLSTFIVSIS